MSKNLVLLALWAISAYGQSNSTPLTNEMIVRRVMSGIPPDTIISTIQAASTVSFRFLPWDLEFLQRYHVPDDVVKAMAAKSKLPPMPGPPLQTSSPKQPPVAAEPQRQQGALTNDSVPKAAKAAVSPNSNLYIEPMNGFENYLAAAILAKKVPIAVVLTQAKADYVVSGIWRESDRGTSGNGSIVAHLRKRTNYSASVSIVDPKASALVFAYSSQRSATHDLSKEIAEDLASHLREEMLPKKK